LVGDSNYLSNLQAGNAMHKNIHFVGHADKPLDWIQMMDVGLLPTTYMSESLPTVIIEYLCCGIPAIVSDAGEIVNMVHYRGKAAGIITPISNNKVSADEVRNAMKLYLNDGTTYSEHKTNALICFQQFEMKKCIDAYCSVYNNAIELNHNLN
jgi:glycosyltransferase involved in cell wall biosynthesis